MRHAMLLVAAGAIPWSAAAEEVRLCGGGPNQVDADGRLLRHLPYPSATRSELVRPPRALAGQCRAIHRDMHAALAAMLTRARAELVGDSAIVALSCYRSQQHQTLIFCRNGRHTQVVAQAHQVAPPGFSEHATGMAIDFGERRGRCKLTGCFARTAAGRWLVKNAPDFGFEMSFPEDNAQGVAFEPWHWRWVGRDGSEKSAHAQDLFAAARERFPTVARRSESPTEVMIAGMAPFAVSIAWQMKLRSNGLFSWSGSAPNALAEGGVIPPRPSSGAAAAGVDGSHLPN